MQKYADAHQYGVAAGHSRLIPVDVGSRPVPGSRQMRLVSAAGRVIVTVINNVFALLTQATLPSQISCRRWACRFLKRNQDGSAVCAFCS